MTKASSTIKLDEFFGINNRFQDISADGREAQHMENFFADDNSLIKVSGSTVLGAFTAADGVTTKNINGAYQCVLNGTEYRLVTGGDAIKTYSGGAFTNITGTETITDSDDIRPQWATFIDNSVAPVAIYCNGVDAPLKWTGSGDVALLDNAPGNFKDMTVQKGRLWACYDDYLVVSDEFDGETWDPLNVIRYINNGEDIERVVQYSGGVCVMQPTKISMVTGSNYRDFYNQEGIVVGDGPVSGSSVQVVDSIRYGQIIVFLSKKDGILKGFNGTPNLIDIGLPAENLFRIMRKSRRPYSVSTVYNNKYYLGMCYSGSGENDKWFVYDFKRDNFTTANGQPASAIYYMTGQSANCMATWSNSDDEFIMVTGNYSGSLLQQDYGLKFEDTENIVSYWNSMKFDFGTPQNVKMITDSAIVTEQETDSTIGVSLNTKGQQATSNIVIEINGYLYDEALYDDAYYGEATNSYTRTPFDLLEEAGQIYGRYFIYSITHSTAEENLKINSIILTSFDLGLQQEFVEV